jgi:acyl-CoA reductase-like NAD-dependent aldehyde dehydrogenase
MTISAGDVSVPIRHADRFFIGGEWVTPSSGSTITVIDSHTEQANVTVAEAQAPDIDRAVTAAREAFDHGPWARLPHAARATYLRAIGAEIRKRSDDIVAMWPRESGVTVGFAATGGPGAQRTFGYYAGLADTFGWERPVKSPRGFGLVVSEPVGVVGAIVPWNTPMALISMKVAPALIAGCTVVLKTSPEAPGEGYLISEAAEAAGLPPGVLNVVCADREVSELLVRDPRVDKVTFTGSTAAGRRIASICGMRIARVTLELGGKSAAVILDDADIETTAQTLAQAECLVSGQVCASRTRVEGYIAKGIAGGATLSRRTSRWASAGSSSPASAAKAENWDSCCSLSPRPFCLTARPPVIQACCYLPGGGLPAWRAPAPDSPGPVPPRHAR